jgi:DNA primase
MDLVLSHQSGVKNVVAASGTALTDESMGESGAVSNLGLVRRLTPNLIVAFDSDNAGRKAALRAAGIALSMAMDVKIADLPEGKDPADMVRDNVESWKDALRNAKPVIEFELGNVLRDNPDPRKAPRALRERVFPFLARIESAMDQAHFVQMIADRAHIAPDAVWADLRATEKQIKTAAGTNAVVTKPNSPLQLKIQMSPEEKISAHTDMVERRMMGLLLLMEKAGDAGAPGFRDTIKNIAGDAYDILVKKIEPLSSDLQYEAEAIFGSDAERWPSHMKELIITYEENIISEQLIQTMQQLRIAEKAGESERMGELAKRCQELSVKKAEVKKRRASHQ